MNSKFKLCDECLHDYRELTFDSNAACMLNLVPLASLRWTDEHPIEAFGGGGTRSEHEGCRQSIIGLATARKLFWRTGRLPDSLHELWDGARDQIPRWPGFKRLVLSTSQLSDLQACQSELDEFKSAVEQISAGMRRSKALSPCKTLEEVIDGMVSELLRRWRRF